MVWKSRSLRYIYLLPKLLYKELYDSFECLQWLPLSSYDVAINILNKLIVEWCHPYKRNAKVPCWGRKFLLSPNHALGDIKCNWRASWNKASLLSHWLGDKTIISCLKEATVHAIALSAVEDLIYYPPGRYWIRSATIQQAIQCSR